MLTAHQETKMADIINLIISGHKRINIEGSAGVGKTFMMQELISILSSHTQGLFYVLAPTHKALAVLKSKVEEQPNIVFKTVHSALCLTKKRDYGTGKESFLPSNSIYSIPFDGCTVCIIDEASMLSSDLMVYLDNHPNLLMIFVGDRQQLPPVGESVSPVFSRGYPTVSVTEIVRQAQGNPIIELSRNLDLLRKQQNHITTKFSDVDLFSEVYAGYLFDNHRGVIIKKLAEANGTDKIKYLAYTNKEVDLMNREVRVALYGIPKKVELGETLIFNKSYGDYFTNQEITVESLNVVDLPCKIPTFNTRFSKRNNEIMSGPGSFDTESFSVYIINNTIPVIHERSEDRYNILLDKLKRYASERKMSWQGFYYLAEQFADITYNHALTVHKSQGSTFNTAVLNLSNINSNKKTGERQKLLYTAITRASELVVLYQE